MRFKATFPALTEFPDIYPIDAVLSLTVPILFLGGKVGETNILDELIWKM